MRGKRLTDTPSPPVPQRAGAVVPLPFVPTTCTRPGMARSGLPMAVRRASIRSKPRVM